MAILRNIGCLATCPDQGGQDDIGVIRDAALVWKQDRIEWVGPSRSLPDNLLEEQQQVYDAGGLLVVPGLVDCHTHLAFGGWRSDEFELRIQGRSYLEIAAAGGGIVSTVRKTRQAPLDALLKKARGCLDEMVALGVTTVECKSGYGLDRTTELKILEVYRLLGEEKTARIAATFLGAHMVPPEFKDRRAEYVDFLCLEMIPEVSSRGLAEFCDVFVEETAFSIEEAEKVLAAAYRGGLRAKVHADQLSSGGGAELAARMKAISADHLERISESGIRALAEAGVVAVSLPLATVYLNQPPMPARDLIRAGVPVAVATDFNPGSAPSGHLPLALTLACLLQRMTPAEALKGSTIYAARAIDSAESVGSLETGKFCDFALIDAPDVNHWLYHFRANACLATVRGGEVISGKLSLA